MEKFMLLFRGSNVYQADRSPEALQVLTVKMLDWLEKLSSNGKHVASERLQRIGKQVSGTQKMVTDSPFGDGGQIIGGCTILLANDINEAVEIAKACPILESNANIEVRPVQNL
jgi:hypothetical protein